MERDRVGVAPPPRAGELRFVIAGDRAGIAVGADDLERPEPALEEVARGAGVDPGGLFADRPPVRRPAEPFFPVLELRRVAERCRAAAPQRGKGVGVPVIRPAGEIGERDRLENGNFGPLLVGRAARGRRRASAPSAPPERRGGCARGEASQLELRVSISFQLGSRERVLREKVQISVTSVTWAGSPSITSPSASRVTLTCSETKVTVTNA